MHASSDVTEITVHERQMAGNNLLACLLMTLLKNWKMLISWGTKSTQKAINRLSNFSYCIFESSLFHTLISLKVLFFFNQRIRALMINCCLKQYNRRDPAYRNLTMQGQEAAVSEDPYLYLGATSDRIFISPIFLSQPSNHSYEVVQFRPCFRLT
jgi:hypothetical protein